MTKNFTGSCHCKKISFEVTAPADWSAHCHCNQCQEIHGAAYVTWVGFNDNKFQIIDPENCLSEFKGPMAIRSFCNNCGSPISFKYWNDDYPHSDEFINYIYFPRPAFDKNIEIKPTHHIYFDAKKDWYEINDNLQKRD